MMNVQEREYQKLMHELRLYEKVDPKVGTILTNPVDGTQVVYALKNGRLTTRILTYKDQKRRTKREALMKAAPTRIIANHLNSKNLRRLASKALSRASEGMSPSKRRAAEESAAQAKATASWSDGRTTPSTYRIRTGGAAPRARIPRSERAPDSATAAGRYAAHMSRKHAFLAATLGAIGTLHAQEAPQGSAIAATRAWLEQPAAARARPPTAPASRACAGLVRRVARTRAASSWTQGDAARRR